MQLDLEISQALYNKLRALNILIGNTSGSSLESLVLDLMETSVSQKILEILDLNTQQTGFDQRAPRIERAHKSPYVHDEISELSDGLGDLEETDPEPVENMFDLVSKRGGLSDKTLEEDMRVDDPEHEAKAEAPSEMPYSQAEALFSHMTGIPLPVEDDDEIDHRILKRKKKLNIKGKVQPASETSLYET